ncbi:MAG: AraC family transcriptional regulator [Eubacteriales bacterium]|nr:AraC family transcriptional regulator [Eubacteriales bacterium]
MGVYNLNQDYPVEVKIRIMAGQVYAASEVGMWCFSKEGDLHFSTCPNEQELLALMRLNGCLDYMIQKECGWDKPVILSDSLGMMFIGESVPNNIEGIKMHILVGPFFMNSSSLKEIEKGLQEKIFSIHAKRAFMRVLQTVPVLHISGLDIYASMLHFTIYDDLIQNTEYYYQVDPKKEENFKDIWEEEEEIPKINEDRSTDIEQRIMQAIREGNVQIWEVMKQASSGAQGFASSSGNQLRDGKNTVVILNALSARAAVEGGLPLRTARFLEQEFIEKIEACKKISELHHLTNQMIDTYVKKVQGTKSNEQISKGIQETCDYIRANVQKELNVEELAARVGYTPYYFSKKFNKEMGVRVTDFIKTARIDHAKLLLITTNKGIQDISDALHFGTRNYFSKVFREVTGVTPAVYREKGNLAEGEK